MRLISGHEIQKNIRKLKNFKTCTRHNKKHKNNSFVNDIKWREVCYELRMKISIDIDCFRWRNIEWWLERRQSDKQKAKSSFQIAKMRCLYPKIAVWKKTPTHAMFFWKITLFHFHLLHFKWRKKKKLSRIEVLGCNEKKKEELTILSKWRKKNLHWIQLAASSIENVKWHHFNW